MAMYKKKEYLIILIVILLFIFGFLLKKNEEEPLDITVSNKNTIVIYIDGEIVRKTKLEYQNKTTYGSVFIRVKSLLNEYSDLSSFDLYETIEESIEIMIPTLDINNNYNSTSLININNATKSELMMLPQIGEKRSEAILNYINSNGKIKTWNEFFSIVSIKDDYKEAIKKQAIL